MTVDITIDIVEVFEITFEANVPAEAAESVESMPNRIMNIAKGGTANLPTKEPTLEGYAFGGWFTDEACTEENKFIFGVGGTPVTANVQLYAKWTAA